MRTWAVLLCAALAGCAGRARPSLWPRPELELTLVPRSSTLHSYSTAVYVNGVLRIYQPTPELRCANPVWSWPDGSRGRAEDCVPDELEPWPMGKDLVIATCPPIPMREGGAITVELCRWVDDHGRCVGRLRQARAEFVLLAP